MRIALAALTFAFTLTAASKYDGPRPPKTDMLYLMHADNLIETELGEAAVETRKDAEIAVLAGSSSPAKTPLAEPIFLIKVSKINPQRLQAYRVEPSKSGKREVIVGHKKGKNAAKPIYLTVSRLEEGLYRVEVDQPLDNGEYTISPDGSNQTFSFQVY
jgi:hypothetical protein